MEKGQAVLAFLGLDATPATPEEGYEMLKSFREATSILATAEKSLKETLFSLAEAHGEKDEKGSFTVQIDEGIGYQKQARVSTSINLERLKALVSAKSLSGIIVEKQTIASEDMPGAIEALEAHAPHWLTAVEVVDEEELEKAVIEEVISSEEFTAIVDKDVTYALVDLAKKKGGKK